MRDFAQKQTKGTKKPGLSETPLYLHGLENASPPFVSFVAFCERTLSLRPPRGTRRRSEKTDFNRSKRRKRRREFVLSLFPSLPSVKEPFPSDRPVEPAGEVKAV